MSKLTLEHVNVIQLQPLETGFDGSEDVLV